MVSRVGSLSWGESQVGPGIGCTFCQCILYSIFISAHILNILILDRSFRDKFLFKGLFQFHVASIKCEHVLGQNDATASSLAADAQHMLSLFRNICGRARFVIFLLSDPHLLEGGQGGQDGATNPD